MNQIKKKILFYSLVLLSLIFFLMPSYKEYKSEQNTKEMLKTFQEEIEITPELPESELDVKGKIIKADKIDLEMPIEYGATFNNMKDSVATIKYETIKEGKNYSIAGHRYLTHGRHFNRIDEFEKGDEIQIITETGGVINYSVYDKLVVDPGDLSVLDDVDKTEITLITCHPPGISSHRLVIKAVKKEWYK